MEKIQLNKAVTDFLFIGQHWRDFYQTLKHRIHVVLPLLGLLGGAALTARPAVHFFERKFNGMTAYHRWSKFKQSTEPIQSGSPVAWLSSPQIKLDTLVLFDANEKNLMNSPCWATQGAGPGNPGPIIILGHRDAHFRCLKDIRVGNTVTLESRYGEIQTFKVTETEICDKDKVPERIELQLYSRKLLLMTCYPFHYIGAAPNRYLVWLDEIGSQSVQ